MRVRVLPVCHAGRPFGVVAFSDLPNPIGRIARTDRDLPRGLPFGQQPEELVPTALVRFFRGPLAALELIHRQMRFQATVSWHASYYNTHTEIGITGRQYNDSTTVCCDAVLLVLTRNALASDWVHMEVNAAISLKHQYRIKGLIFVKAGTVEPIKLPPLWGVFNACDASKDYDLSLDQTLKSMGLDPVVDSAPSSNDRTYNFNCYSCGALNTYQGLGIVMCVECGDEIITPIPGILP
jgi:hypothetical protein